MRIAYLDCFAGISGDMFLGALVDAGVPVDVLTGAVSSLGLDVSLRLEKVDRSGISATKVHVFEGEELAEKPHLHEHKHVHGHKHDHSHPHDHSHSHDHHERSHDRSFVAGSRRQRAGHAHLRATGALGGQDP
jgi:uncharacterized protein (DUF111 family)